MISEPNSRPPAEPTADAAGATAVWTLPPRARLLHIGLPKTGTTALQSTAQAKRADLLAHGVRYPGGGLNHRHAVSSLMGRRWGWIGPGSSVPTLEHWQRLMEEVEADTTSRVWISHEFASESDDETAERFATELGPSLHVVITLRPFGQMLASSWQQYLKGGTVHPFDTWLDAVLSDPPNTKVTPSFHRRNDQAGVIRRWASAVGAANVTAVVVDKRQPTMLTDSFEQLLGLPAGFLVDEALGGLQVNRAMSWEESEFLRRLNLVIKDQVDWPTYEAIIRNGAVARFLQLRTPGPSESPVQPPRAAARRADELGQAYAQAVMESGVRIMGDVDVLRAPRLRPLPTVA